MSEAQNDNLDQSLSSQESFWEKAKDFFEEIWGNIEDFFEEIWGNIEDFFEGMGKFFSRNKYKFGLGFGIFVIAGAITASVFFGPALYTAITGLLPAVIPGLAAITTGLAATIPFVGFAIIAATILAVFALGLYFTIDSARSLKPQIELSENQTLLNNDQNQPIVDPNQPPVAASPPQQQQQQQQKGT